MKTRKKRKNDTPKKIFCNNEEIHVTYFFVVCLQIIMLQIITVAIAQ